jgi:hypothetical protein
MTYTGPRLSDLQADLDQTCMAALGDTVRYRPAGGAFADKRAYIDYPETLFSPETGTMIAQDIMVDILKADVPTKPTGSCRITLGALPGKLFKPVNVRSDKSGTHWQFEVVETDV